MASQLDVQPLMPIRYLTTVGSTVVAFTTYAEAMEFVATYRTTHTARIDTQLQHCSGWETHASRIWSDAPLPVRSGHIPVMPAA
jgi:hypothetical protein